MGLGIAGIALAKAAAELGEKMTGSLISRVGFGAYAANEPWPDLSAHHALESALGVRFPTMSWFLGFDSGWPTSQAAAAAGGAYDLQICLQPALYGGKAVPFTDIQSGAWNSRLDRFFASAAAYPYRVAIRFAHEMNLSQLVQSVANSAPCTSSLSIWLDTWRYIVDRQRAIGGNVEWQWCVSSVDMGPIPAESYWPGADYVDIMSIDVYNGYGPWTPGVKLIKPMYDRITRLDPYAPVWLAELGCRPATATDPYGRAQWYQELFSTTEFPRLAKVAFFHQNKEYDWRITGPDVVSTMSNMLQNVVR